MKNYSLLKFSITALILSCFAIQSYSQVLKRDVLNVRQYATIGTSDEDSSATLTIDDPTKGLLINRLTTTERDNISGPANGLIIFNKTENEFQYNSGTPAVPVWTGLTPTGGGTVPAGVVDGSGTDDYVVKWVDGANNEIGDGTWKFGVNGNLVPVQDNTAIGSNTLRVDSIYMSSVIDYANDLQFYNGGNRLEIDGAGAMTINGAYTLPTADGTAGQVLQTDGLGNVTYETISAGDGNGIYTGTGDNLDANHTVTLSDGATTDRTLTFASIDDANLLHINSSTDQVIIGATTGAGKLSIAAGASGNNELSVAKFGGGNAFNVWNDGFTSINTVNKKYRLTISSALGEGALAIADDNRLFGWSLLSGQIFQSAGISTNNHTWGYDNDAGVGLTAIEWMRLNSTGLGIGVTPSEKLHVGGNARVDGNAYINGSQVGSNIMTVRGSGASTTAPLVSFTNSTNSEGIYFSATQQSIGRSAVDGGIHLSIQSTAAGIDPLRILNSAAGNLVHIHEEGGMRIDGSHTSHETRVGLGRASIGDVVLVTQASSAVGASGLQVRDDGGAVMVDFHRSASNFQHFFMALPAYDDDTDAGTGGLNTGDMYQTTGAGASPLNVAGIVMMKQ